jgi:hypothetical protein
MSLGKRLFIGEAAAAACTTESADVFGDSSGVALYSLDYDASDESGNYDGTPSNVEFGVDGQINWGASFNGSSSIIDLGTSSPLNTFGGEQTISLWIYPTTSTHQGIIGYRNDTTLQWNYVEKMSNNTIRFLLRSSSSPLTVFNTTGTVTLNEWNHIVVTVNSTTAKIYINNGTAESLASTVTSFSNSESTKIGENDALQGVNYFNGKIDQIRIFNKELSSTEVSTLYGETACVHTATTDTLNYQATNRAYYKLDNNTLDETSNNHYGTENSITYEFGRYGAAADFNGSSSYINVAHNSAFNWGSNKTLSVWVKFDAIGSLAGIVSKHTATSGSYGWSLYLSSSSKIQFVQYSSSNTTSTLQSGFTAKVGRWYHICVTGDGTTNKLYIENVENDSQSAVTANSITQDLVFGRLFSNSTGYNHNGQIDQLRFYESTLDTTAIENLYNEKQAYITKNASDPFGDEEAFYKFDNNTNDSTGSYNMTNRNITFSTDSAIGTHSGEFNGTSSEGIISSTTTTPVDFSAEDFTISFWAKVDNFTNTVYPLSKWGGSNADRTILTSIRSTGFEDFVVYENNGSGNVQMIHSQTLEADRWHHFAYTRNGSTGTIYVDGVGESFARTNTINTTNNDMFIGNVSEASTLWFDGHIDSIRFFSRCLDGDEVFKLYAEVIN